MIHFVAVGLDEISLDALTENSFFQLEAVFIFSQAIFPLSQVETNNLLTRCSKILDPSLHINTTRLLETFQPLKAVIAFRTKFLGGLKVWTLALNLPQRVPGKKNKMKKR